MESLTLNNADSTIKTNSGSLKAKLNEIEETLQVLNDRMTANRKSIQIQKNEKDNFKAIIEKNTKTVQENLTEQIKILESEMGKHFGFQNSENQRFYKQVSVLISEKNSLRSSLVGLQKRISQTEKHIGN